MTPTTYSGRKHVFSFSAEYVRLILHEDIASRIVLRNLYVSSVAYNAGMEMPAMMNSVAMAAMIPLTSLPSGFLDMPLVPKPAENLI